MKNCRVCKKDKPEDQFYKHKSTPDRLQTACKVCYKKRVTEYYEENQVQINEKRKRQYRRSKLVEGILE